MLLIHAELTIGFINAPYHVEHESDGFATVEFGIVDGTIGPSVSMSVELVLSDGTAKGKFLKSCTSLCPFC